MHHFFRGQLTAAEIAGRRILEVGSRDVNGTVRPFLTSLGARDYMGVDMMQGPGVDRICDVADLAAGYSKDPFEVVVTTEMLEHVRNWRIAIDNLKRVVAPGGLLVITTRSFGFPYHDYPGDYWRYELEDMTWIFRDFLILSLLPDPDLPGVFLKCRKPAEYHGADLSGRKLFSMVNGERAEPDSFTEEEADRYCQRMTKLSEIAVVAAGALRGIDLSDVGQRDFRNLWRSVVHLADLIERLIPGSAARPPASPWSRGLAKIGREALELLTAARLARGRSFGRARTALLKSAQGASGTNVMRIPWARVEEQSFREILASADSIRALCLKAQSYARPAAGA